MSEGRRTRPAGTLRRGDEVQVGKLGPHIVSRIEGPHEDGRIVVVYFRHLESVVGLRGVPGERDRLVELGLRAMRPDELVIAARGVELEANRLELKMALDAAARWRASSWTPWS